MGECNHTVEVLDPDKAILLVVGLITDAEATIYIQNGWDRFLRFFLHRWPYFAIVENCDGDFGAIIRIVPHIFSLNMAQILLEILICKVRRYLISFQVKSVNHRWNRVR
jgi:hypothetical protein